MKRLEENLTTENMELIQKLREIQYLRYDFDGDGLSYTEKSFLSVAYRQQRPVEISNEFGQKIARIFIDREKTTHHQIAEEDRKKELADVL